MPDNQPTDDLVEQATGAVVWAFTSINPGEATGEANADRGDREAFAKGATVWARTGIAPGGVSAAANVNGPGWRHRLPA